MNIAYFRKSSFDMDKTVQNVKDIATKNGFTLLGVTELPNHTGAVVHICKETWMKNIIASDYNLLGLLPCAVAIIAKNNEVIVGMGSPAVLGSVSSHPAIAEISTQAEKILKELIHSAAGVGPLKAVGVKLYSTTTCPYCKMEAAWLSDKKVAYDEVKVDLDQKQAEEMVKKTGQMGVPVTTITYEGGEEEHIVGFDKDRLSTILQVS